MKTNIFYYYNKHLEDRVTYFEIDYDEIVCRKTFPNNSKKIINEYESEIGKLKKQVKSYQALIVIILVYLLLKYL